MAMTDREIQEAYRERMYAAGYKQTRIWVPRNPKALTARDERQFFVQKMNALTAGWSKARLTRLFADLTNIIKERKREVGKKP